MLCQRIRIRYYKTLRTRIKKQRNVTFLFAGKSNLINAAQICLLKRIPQYLGWWLWKLGAFRSSQTNQGPARKYNTEMTNKYQSKRIEGTSNTLPTWWGPCVNFKKMCFVLKIRYGGQKNSIKPSQGLNLQLKYLCEARYEEEFNQFSSSWNLKLQTNKPYYFI